MLGHEIRKCLHNGTMIYGTHVSYMTNLNSASMLLRVGLDYAFICGEHMPLDRAATCSLCRFFAASGVAPIVRISRADPNLAAMALDAGAHGIVAPYVETVKEVEDLVGAVHYRPLKGEKLENIIRGGAEVSDKMKAFFKDFNHDNFLIIGIESVSAVNHLKDLVNVPGVDGVFIGPHDMTTSLGYPTDYQNPEYQKIIEKIIIESREAGIGVGGHFQPANMSISRMHELMSLGMNWILDASDINYAVNGLKNHKQQLNLPDYNPARSMTKCDIQDAVQFKSCI